MNKQIEIVALGNKKIELKEEDRIFSILYRSYWNEIEKHLHKYEEALQRDSKAVSNIKLASAKKVLQTNHPSSELAPYAGAIRVLIREYREKYEYDTPDMVLYELQKTFETIGLQILEKVFADEECKLNGDNLERRIKKFENKYLVDEYENEYIGSDSYEEYLSHYKWDDYNDLNEYMLIKYANKRFWDVFEKENDRFGNMDEFQGTNADMLIQDVLKEIEWRQEYLKNPSFNSLIYKIRLLCAQTILEVIRCTSDALELNLNMEYAMWENYQICLRNINTLRKQSGEDSKKMVLEALKAFPFEKPLYKYIYREFGDVDGAVTKLADYYGMDITDYKKEVMEEYVEMLPTLNLDSEEDILMRLEIIQKKKKDLAYDELLQTENVLNKRLQEIDIMKRTVRGKLYESRDEATNVQKDYEVLEKFINRIEFSQYNLLEKKVSEEVKTKVFSLSFMSDSFNSDHTYVLAELDPILNYQIKLQTWSKELKESRKPWETSKKIILESDIPGECKEKLKYWDFDGLKKYYPVLIEFERPILFWQVSLFGWSSYYVLTNKRVLHVNKIKQTAIELKDCNKIEYLNGQVQITESMQKEHLEISVRCPVEKIKYLKDVLNVLGDALCECDERIFEVAEDYYPNMSNVTSVQEDITNQIKGLFQGKVSPLLKKAQKSLNGILESADIQELEKTQRIRFCSQCGASVKEDDRFCSSCGAKIR